VSLLCSISIPRSSLSLPPSVALSHGHAHIKELPNAAVQLLPSMCVCVWRERGRERFSACVCVCVCRVSGFSHVRMMVAVKKGVGLALEEAAVWYKYSIREVISQQRLLSFTVSKGTRTFPGTQMRIVYSTSFDFIHRTMYTTSPKNIYASSCTRTPSLTCTPPPPHTLSCVQRTSGAGRRSMSSFRTNRPAAATKRCEHQPSNTNNETLTPDPQRKTSTPGWH
jgi:hypothetical protein